MGRAIEGKKERVVGCLKRAHVSADAFHVAFLAHPRGPGSKALVGGGTVSK